MKHIFTTAFLICSSLGLFGQDTTALRWVGVTNDDYLTFFKTDTTDLTSYSAGYGTGQGIFINSQDSLIYGILTSSGTSNDRNLYSINPFTGAHTLIWDLTVDYISSADISADGKTLYVIEGNGGSGLGNITAVDLATGTETFLTTALGDPGSSSYGLEFNPADSSLYVFEGSWAGATRVQIIDLATLSNNNSAMVGWSTQVHGAKWVGPAGQFIVTAGYGCDMLMTDATGNNLVSFYNTCPLNTSDLEEITMLRSESTATPICPTSDSIMISAIYPGTNIHWYRNSTLLASTSDVLYAKTAGTYRALVEIGGTGNFMWSEPIVVTNVAVPVVNITQAANDTLICPDDTITLNGASGGTLQWFRNGVAISGANTNTYDATMAGAYNQLKTNLSGCSDSSATTYVIEDQLTGCFLGMNEAGTGTFTIYPNPVESNLVIESTEMMEAVTVFDVLGKPVYRTSNVNSTRVTLDLHVLNAGTYFVRISTATGDLVHKVQK